jgi:hypothetical protein
MNALTSRRKRKLVRVPWSKTVVEMFFFNKKKAIARPDHLITRFAAGPPPVVLSRSRSTSAPRHVGDPVAVGGWGGLN